MNKINRFLSVVSILSISQIASAVVVTGYTSPNSAGGGVAVNWTGSVYDRTEDEAKKEAAAEAAKAEKKSREKAKKSCKENNLAFRMTCMSGARARYDEQNSRCSLYYDNAVFYGGVATTGVATVPAAIIGGGFAIAAYNCAQSAESDRDRTLQACQDTYDQWDATVCESI